MKPIVFSGPMVRAILNGEKTVTRRLITQATATIDGPTCSHLLYRNLDFAKAWVDQGPSPAGNPGPYLKAPGPNETVHRVYPRVQVGDTLYVREVCFVLESGELLYSATTPAPSAPRRFRSARFMPQCDARLFLRVESVVPERLHEITDSGAAAEGLGTRDGFAAGWNRINGARGSWETNPWVWVIGFAVHDMAPRRS